MGCCTSKSTLSESQPRRPETKQQIKIPPSGENVRIASALPQKAPAGGAHAEKGGILPAPTEFPEDLPDDITDLVKKLKDKASKSGGFSDIYEGELSPGGQKVAIKCLRAVNLGSLHPESPQAQNRLDKRLQRELRVWKPLKHARIVPCIGYATIDKMPCLVSPWYENGNAQEYIMKHPTCNRKALVMQVAEGLDYLHKRNVVHYDLKSPNILISNSGQAMLSDFGIAKVLEETRTGLTTSNSTALSIRFSSPEALEGGSRDLKSDVYSFACLVLELLTGRIPYYNLKVPSTIIAAKFRGTLPDTVQFPELPANDPLWKLLTRCWDAEPKVRPTMSEIIQELKRLGYKA